MSDIVTAATHLASQNENVTLNNEPRRDAAFGGEAEAAANVVPFHPPDDAATNPREQDGEAVATVAGEHPEIADDDLDDGETLDALDIAAGKIKHDYERRTLPFPEPVSGVELLNELVAVIRRFMVLPPGAAETLALWIMLSYAIYPCGIRFAPRLMIRKPVSESGGTNLIMLLLHLIRRPKYNSGISDATLFRQANERRTVIIDECDNAVMQSNRKLVRMLNAGHGIAGTESRTEKNKDGKWVPVAYPIFAPVILCGIGNYAPVTVRNRSFVIALKRKMPGEDVDEFHTTEHA